MQAHHQTHNVINSHLYRLHTEVTVLWHLLYNSLHWNLLEQDSNADSKKQHYVNVLFSSMYMSVSWLCLAIWNQLFWTETFWQKSLYFHTKTLNVYHWEVSKIVRNLVLSYLIDQLILRVLIFLFCFVLNIVILPLHTNHGCGN